jgi:hypothetical protein
VFKFDKQLACSSELPEHRLYRLQGILHQAVNIPIAITIREMTGITMTLFISMLSSFFFG